jgi:hypothetical protein
MNKSLVVALARNEPENAFLLAGWRLATQCRANLETACPEQCALVAARLRSDQLADLAECDITPR